MKNLLLIASFFVSALSFGQGYFRSDGSLGAALTIGNLKSYGISAGVEPKWFFNDNVSLGLRMEGDVLFGGSISGDGEDVTVGLSSRAAYGIKGEYYLGDGNTKPFIGLMAGYYTQANIGNNVKGDNVSVSASAVRSLGIGPELGITFGNFRISGIYHFVPGKDLVSINTSVGGAEQVSVSRNYLVVQLGFRLFGIDDQ